MLINRQRKTIGRQIIVPIFALLLISNGLVAGITFYELRQQLLLQHETDLLSETETLSVQFNAAIQELVHDVRFIAGTPPFQGIIRAQGAAGVDPDDGSSIASWKQRLATIFAQLLKSKRHSVQIRYILADGEELLRVDRYGPNNTIRVVPEGELQNKAHRDYFIDTMALDEDQVYLSDINLNREFGRIVEPPESMIRAAILIFTPAGERHGMLIINQSMDSSFDSVRNLAEAGHEVLIANDEGDYLYHVDPRLAFQFEYGERSNIFDDFVIAKLLAPGKAQDSSAGIVDFFGSRKVIALNRLHYNPYNNDQFVIIASMDSAEHALTVRDELAERVYLVLILTVLMALFLGTLNARRISAPISAMANAIRLRKRGGALQGLPIAAPGEIGDLAMAFEELDENLSSRRKALEVEVAERKAAQVQLEQGLEKLRQANEELEQFAYIASHDLQEPLRTVRSFIELLEKNYYDSLDEKGKKIVGFIMQSSGRMQELIRGLLDYSRIGVDSPRSEVDCQSLVDGICDDLQVKIQEKNAVVQYEGLPTIYGQATELRQLFQNFMSNAIKFSRPDVPPIVRIAAEPCKGGWQFSVCDNGIGIPPEY